MEFLAHILAGACKAGLRSIKSDYGEVDIELTRRNMQKFITWTKNIQKGVWALRDAHIHCGIKEKRLLTPVSARFAYLIHSFRSLLDNKPTIEYIYGTMPGIHYNIQEWRPSRVDRGVIKMIVTSMKRIVGSIALNQCSGKEWFLSEAILYLLWIYTYCSCDDVDDDVSKHLDKMVEDRGNLPDAENLCSNLLEVYSKMKYRVKDKLTNVRAPLIQIPVPTKDHYWFSLFLDPRYVMELKDINTFHRR